MNNSCYSYKNENSSWLFQMPSPYLMYFRNEFHSSTLVWKNPMDRGAWWAAVHGVAKSQRWLSNFTFTFHFHALEKETATHSSVLAWRIPGMAEPGRLRSKGLHRVGHDWCDLAAAAGMSYVKHCITADIFIKIISENYIQCLQKTPGDPWMAVLSY